MVNSYCVYMDAMVIADASLCSQLCTRDCMDCVGFVGVSSNKVGFVGHFSSKGQVDASIDELMQVYFTLCYGKPSPLRISFVSYLRNERMVQVLVQAMRVWRYMVPMSFELLENRSRLSLNLNINRINKRFPRKPLACLGAGVFNRKEILRENCCFTTFYYPKSCEKQGWKFRILSIIYRTLARGEDAIKNHFRRFS